METENKNRKFNVNAFEIQLNSKVSHDDESHTKHIIHRI